VIFELQLKEYYPRHWCPKKKVWKCGAIDSISFVCDVSRLESFFAKYFYLKSWVSWLLKKIPYFVHFTWQVAFCCYVSQRFRDRLPFRILLGFLSFMRHCIHLLCISHVRLRRDAYFSRVCDVAWAMPMAEIHIEKNFYYGFHIVFLWRLR